MKKVFISLSAIFTLFISISNAQSDFILIDDTICVDEPFSPDNESKNTSEYLWHFNSANMANKNMSPNGTNLGNTGPLSSPTFIALAEDSGYYYTFSTNLNTRNITRNFFNRSLTNSPIPDNIAINSLYLPTPVEGIQIVKDGNTWYGFVIGGKSLSSRLVCMSFGNSLKNTPTVLYSEYYTSDFPMDLTIVRDNGNWYGFTANQLGNFITRFNFVNGLNKKPTATNLTLNEGILLPWGLSQPVKSNSGNWYMFVTCMSSDTLKRINFGSSLSYNGLSVNNFNTPLIKEPLPIRIIKDCEKTFGLIVNNKKGYITQLDFINGIENEPIYTDLGNIGSLNMPHGMSAITRSGNDIFAFITNKKDNTISKIQYHPGIVPPTSIDVNPTSSYPDSGNYNINLIAWQDTFSKSCICKSITVLEKPRFSLGNDTMICPFDKILLGIKEDFTSYLWNNQSTDKTTYTDTDSIYWLQAKNINGCSNRDSITISRFPDNFTLGNDASFTLGQSIILDATEDYSFYRWNRGDTTSSIEVKKPGIYWVSVKEAVANTSPNTRYCSFKDTIILTIHADLPNVITPNSDGANDTWKPLLFYHYPEAEVYVYDRFGKLIVHFRGDDPTGWDGTYNNRIVTPDSYWYVIDLKDGSTPLRGSLTVITK